MRSLFGFSWQSLVIAVCVCATPTFSFAEGEIKLQYEILGESNPMAHELRLVNNSACEITKITYSYKVCIEGEMTCRTPKFASSFWSPSLSPGEVRYLLSETQRKIQEDDRTNQNRTHLEFVDVFYRNDSDVIIDGILSRSKNTAVLRAMEC